MVRGDFCGSAFSPPLDETRSEVRYAGRSENASPATGSGKRHQQEQVEIINDALRAGAISQTYKVRVVARRRKLGSASARRQTVHDVRFLSFFLQKTKGIQRHNRTSCTVWGRSAHLADHKNRWSALLVGRQVPDATKPQIVDTPSRQDPAAVRNAEEPSTAAPRAPPESPCSHVAWLLLCNYHATHRLPTRSSCLQDPGFPLAWPLPGTARPGSNGLVRSR